MIAVIGGTGDQGRGLVLRFALAGEEVIIGSRYREKAERVAAELIERAGKRIEGTTNLEATRRAGVVVLSVPYEAMGRIVEEIRPALMPEKVLITVVAPVKIEGKRVELELPPAGSAAEELVALIPKGVGVAAAFQTVAARRLQDISKGVDCDVVVCADDERAKRVAMELAEKLPGVRAVDGGGLRNSRFVESLTALLMELTLRRRAAGVGVRFEGL